MSDRVDAADRAVAIGCAMQRQAEIFEMAVAMTDPGARRHMLFISDSYGRMAEREEERADWLRRGR